MRTKKTWYWVLGDTKKGFDIVTKKPRRKYVPEPFDSLFAAQKWIAFQWLMMD